MDRRIFFLKEGLREKLQAKISVEEMANLVNVSPVYLRQLFKSETGQMVKQSVRGLRLEKSKDLLETTFLRVKEIGVLVGLPNQSKFARYFKEKYGITPGECQDLRDRKNNENQNEL